MCDCLQAVGRQQRHVAVAGAGAHLQVWDLEAQARLLAAKGGKPNMLGLVDKPLVTALAFIPGQGDQQVCLVPD